MPMSDFSPQIEGIVAIVSQKIRMRDAAEKIPPSKALIDEKSYRDG